MALTSDRDTVRRNGEEFEFEAASTVYAGSMVCLNSDGKLVPASITAGCPRLWRRAAARQGWGEDTRCAGASSRSSPHPETRPRSPRSAQRVGRRTTAPSRKPRPPMPPSPGSSSTSPTRTSGSKFRELPMNINRSTLEQFYFGVSAAFQGGLGTAREPV